MAQNVNSVVITGNLTRDPELRVTPGGASVCSMRVAVNAREKTGGEWKDRANYFDVIVWGRQGESCAQYLTKGRPLAVQGRLRWREWSGDSGKRQTVEIIADTVQFLGSRDGAGGGDGDYGYSGGSSGDDFGAGGGGDDFGTGGSEDVDSDIPFAWIDNTDATGMGRMPRACWTAAKLRMQ